MIGYIVYFHVVYLPIRFSVGDRALGSTGWLIVCTAALFALTASYIGQVRATRKQSLERKTDGIIYRCIGGAIEEMDLRKQKGDYIREILNYIERVVPIILADVEIGRIDKEISANMMVLINEELQIKYLGTHYGGRRRRLTLKIDKSNPLPGAPEAVIFGRIIYIPDIRDNSIREHFEKINDIRSFISIPLRENNNNIFGVLNIDSPIKDQFHSKELIEKRIMPAIKPLIFLLELRWNIAIQK